MPPLINSAMKGICLIALICLFAASITTAMPLGASGETPATNESGIEVNTSDAMNPLAPAMVGGCIPRRIIRIPTIDIGKWLKRWIKQH